MAGLELILCPECGKDLSSLEQAYEYLTIIKKEKHVDDTDPRVLQILKSNINYKDILDFLGLDKICCRSHKISEAKIKHLYYT